LAIRSRPDDGQTRSRESRPVAVSVAQGVRSSAFRPFWAIFKSRIVRARRDKADARRATSARDARKSAPPAALRIVAASGGARKRAA
jgi:TPP-dependent trihydroxycyclohexane-1,2-dione (THcHDO) dehydratase